MPNVWWWIGFNGLILVLLAIDLGVFNRKAHAVSVREALGWSALWISLAVLFGLWIGQSMGRQSMLEFYAGYLVEQALCHIGRYLAPADAAQTQPAVAALNHLPGAVLLAQHGLAVAVGRLEEADGVRV